MPLNGLCLAASGLSLIRAYQEDPAQAKKFFEQAKLAYEGISDDELKRFTMPKDDLARLLDRAQAALTMDPSQVFPDMKKLTDPLSLDNLRKYKPRPGAAESSIDPEIGADASEQQEEQEAEEDEGAIAMLRYTDVEKDIARNVLEAFLDSDSDSESEGVAEGPHTPQPGPSKEMSEPSSSNVIQMPNPPSPSTYQGRQKLSRGPTGEANVASLPEYDSEGELQERRERRRRKAQDQSKQA